MTKCYLKRLWRLAAFPLLTILPAAGAYAQTPAWQWATSPGMYESPLTNSLAVDPAGNVIVAGLFSGTATFGSTTLTSMGGNDIYVAKLSPAGTYLWAVYAGGVGEEWTGKVTLDGNGDIYLTGSFFSTAAFGSFTLSNRSSSLSFSDAFVAKLSAGGVWQWAVSPAGSGNEAGNALAVDGSGRVYVSGFIGAGTTVFGSTTLTSAGSNDAFVARLSPTGVWQWATRAGGTQSDAAYGLDLDTAGNVYITGSYTEPATFGSTTLTDSSAVPDGQAFVARLSSAGAWQWAVGAGGSQVEAGYDVPVDSSGTAFVTGIYNSPVASFGSMTIPNGGSTAGNPRFDSFVARITAAGVWQWVVGVGGTGGDFVYDMAPDGAGGAVVTGSFTSPTMTFGATTLTNGSGALNGDVFVARLDSGGVWEWAARAGSSGNDQGFAVGMDSSERVYVAGAFDSPVLSFGPASLTFSGGFNQYGTFIASLSPAMGLPTEEASAEGSIWPNPAHEVVQVSGIPSGSATLFDQVGRPVRDTSVVGGRAVIDVRGLPPGLYVMRAGPLVCRLVVK